MNEGPRERWRGARVKYTVERISLKPRAENGGLSYSWILSHRKNSRHCSDTGIEMCQWLNLPSEGCHRSLAVARKFQYCDVNEGFCEKRANCIQSQRSFWDWTNNSLENSLIAQRLGWQAWSGSNMLSCHATKGSKNPPGLSRSAISGARPCGPC